MKVPNLPPPCPVYLGGQLAQRWEALAPELVKLGTLDDLNADVLGKYILAENEYLRISQLLQDAINRGDADDAPKWVTAQDRLTKQILALGGELGITPTARRARGLGRR
jgi:P27 family predicted phage terminase small subunit